MYKYTNTRSDLIRLKKKYVELVNVVTTKQKREKNKNESKMLKKDKKITDI